MAIRVFRSQSNVVSLRLTQTLSMVLRPSSSSTDLLVTPTNWAFSSLFGNELHHVCAVATTSVIFLEIPKELAQSTNPDSSSIGGQWNGVWKMSENSSFQVHPPPCTVSGSPHDPRGFLLSYEHFPQKGLDLGFEWIQEMSATSNRWNLAPTDTQVQTFQSNMRGDSGGLVFELNWPVKTAVQERVCFLQQIPWFIRVWIHSIQIAFDGKVRLEPIGTHLS